MGTVGTVPPTSSAMRVSITFEFDNSPKPFYTVVVKDDVVPFIVLIDYVAYFKLKITFIQRRPTCGQSIMR